MVRPQALALLALALASSAQAQAPAMDLLNVTAPAADAAVSSPLPPPLLLLDTATPPPDAAPDCRRVPFSSWDAAKGSFDDEFKVRGQRLDIENKESYLLAKRELDRPVPVAPGGRTELELRWSAPTMPAAALHTGRRLDDDVVAVLVGFGTPFKSDRASFYHPAAPYTVAYFWGTTERPDEVYQGHEAYPQVRYLCLRAGASRDAALERRDLAADFRRLFPELGDRPVPPVTGLAVESDMNTGDGTCRATVERLAITVAADAAAHPAD